MKNFNLTLSISFFIHLKRIGKKKFLEVHGVTTMPNTSGVPDNPHTRRKQVGTKQTMLCENIFM